MTPHDVRVLRAAVRDVPAVDWTKSDDLTRFATDVANALPPGTHLVGPREVPLRYVLMAAVVDWVQRSHGSFPEHDHHCPVQSPKATEGCTCGYAAASTALAELDRMDAE